VTALNPDYDVGTELACGAGGFAGILPSVLAQPVSSNDNTDIQRPTADETAGTATDAAARPRSHRRRAIIALRVALILLSGLSLWTAAQAEAQPRLLGQIGTPVQSDKEIGELVRCDVKKSFGP
jgi:hypothetical protein